MMFRGDCETKTGVLYIIVQIVFGIMGTLLAHLMFDLELVQWGTHARTGLGQWVGEVVATFALIFTILACLAHRPEAVPYAVGLYITAAYWFTASTSFANPAVTIARTLTDTFSGIHPANAPLFIVCQIVGALLATFAMAWLLIKRPAERAAPAKAG